MSWSGTKRCWKRAGIQRSYQRPKGPPWLNRLRAPVSSAARRPLAPAEDLDPGWGPSARINALLKRQTAVIQIREVAGCNVTPTSSDARSCFSWLLGQGCQPLTFFGQLSCWPPPLKLGVTLHPPGSEPRPRPYGTWGRTSSALPVPVSACLPAQRHARAHPRVPAPTERSAVTLFHPDWGRRRSKHQRDVPQLTVLKDHQGDRRGCPELGAVLISVQRDIDVVNTTSGRRVAALQWKPLPVHQIRRFMPGGRGHLNTL